MIELGLPAAPPCINEPVRRDGAYRLISPRFPPYEHQRRAVENAVKGIVESGFHALFMEMGTGKTKTTLDTWAILTKKEVSDALLIIAPKSLMSTWADEEIPKHLCVPARTLVWDGKATKKSKEAFEAFFSSPGPIVFIANVEAFQTLNDELRDRVSRILRGRKTVLAADECFAPDVEVDVFTAADGGLTPAVKKAIKNVVVGDIVNGVNGPSVVVGTARRQVDGAVFISYNGRTITCSKNHLFLTRRGWLQARYVQPGDYLSSPEEAMRLVRGGVHSESEDKTWENPEVLRTVLLGEMEDEARGYKSEGLHARGKGEISTRDEGVLYCSPGPCGHTGGAYQGIESDGESRVAEKMFRDASGDEASSNGARRQWNRTHRPAKKTARYIRRRMASRIINTHEDEKGARIPYMLQGGYRKSREKNSYRGGRFFSLFKAGSRSEEGLAPGFIRVDSVEVLEQTDPRLDRLRDAEGRLYFHDLEVAGHPSFSVNGAVVHNSSTLKSPDAKRSKNIKAAAKLAVGRLILTGTEISKSPLDLYMQFEILKDKFWGVRSFFIFRLSYAILEDAYGPGGRTFKRVVGYQKIGELTSRIEPYTTRAMKKDCLDLPEKIKTVVRCEMGSAQEKMYAELKRHLATILESGEILTVENKISLFTKFRQITGGTLKNGDEAIIIDPCPGKLSALIDEVQDTDEQVIVWAAFKAEIHLIAKALEPYGKVVTFDGSTEIDERDEAKLAFQRGEARFFVANMKTGAYGLNLQNCHIQYVYSRDTSPITNWQAEDRSHRPGQKHPCVYKSLVVPGTVDERIEELIAQSTDLRSLIQSGAAVDMFRYV